MAEADKVKLRHINIVEDENVDQQIKRVKDDIRNWHKDEDIFAIYIGKTSTNTKADAYAAMNSRNDKTKADLGINEMVLLYLTKSKKRINQAERELIEYNQKQGKKCGNDVGGGGGAPADKQWHVLYAALGKKRKPPKKK